MLLDYLDDTTIWSSHVQSDGSQIGGVDPLDYGIQPSPDRKPEWLMWTAGNSQPPTGWPSVMFFPAVSWERNATAALRPILPNTGNLAIAHSFVVGSSAQIGGNTREVDCKLVTQGLMFDMSLHRIISTGEIDIGTNWADTKLRLGMIASNTTHKERVQWSFNPAAKTFQAVSYEYDGTVYPIPESIGVMPAVPSTWEDGVYVQFQMDSLPVATPWAQRVSRVRLEWS